MRCILVSGAFFCTSIVHLQDPEECTINNLPHPPFLVCAPLFSLVKQAFRPIRVFDVPRSERVITSNTPVATDQGPYDVQDGMSPMAGGGIRGGQDQTVVGGNGDGTTATTDLGGHRGRGGGRSGGFFSRAVDSVVSIAHPFSAVRDVMRWHRFYGMGWKAMWKWVGRIGAKEVNQRRSTCNTGI